MRRVAESGRRLLMRALTLSALVLAGAVGLCVVAPGTVRAAVPAPEWAAGGQITFEVRRGEGGMKLGEARHRWRHDGARYTMETTLETTGLAALLVDFQYVQRSEGRVLASGLQPERFRVEQAGRPPEAAEFDWKSGKVVIERKGQRTESALKAGDQDVLSVWHLAAVNKGRALPAELNLVTNRRVSPATIESLGREAVSVPMGTFDMQHFQVRAKTGKLTVDLWVSEQHGHVPLRIMITDDKGMVLDQRALAFEPRAMRGGDDGIRLGRAH